MLAKKVERNNILQSYLTFISSTYSDIFNTTRDNYAFYFWCIIPCIYYSQSDRSCSVLKGILKHFQ